MYKNIKGTSSVAYPDKILLYKCGLLLSAASGPGWLLAMFLAEWSASSLLLSCRLGGGVPGV